MLGIFSIECPCSMCFCRTSLPLARTIWAQLTLSCLCPLFKALPSLNLSIIKKFFCGKLRIEPAAAGWEASMIPLCYAALPSPPLSMCLWVGLEEHVCFKQLFNQLTYWKCFHSDMYCLLMLRTVHESLQGQTPDTRRMPFRCHCWLWTPRPVQLEHHRGHNSFFQVTDQRKVPWSSILVYSNNPLVTSCKEKYLNQDSKPAHDPIQFSSVATQHWKLGYWIDQNK